MSAAVLAVLLAAATGCSDKATGGSGGTGKDGVKHGPGVTDTTIKLGVITDLTGPYAPLGKGLTQAEQLYVEEINKAGGICGRKLELVVRDAGYDVQKSMSAYSELQGSTLAIPQLIGSHVASALKTRINSDKVLTIPMAWSNTLLGSEYLQITGPTYDVDMINGIDWLVKTGAVKKGGTLGHIYFDNDYGASALLGTKYAADKHGLKVVEQKIKPTDTDLTNQAGALAKQKVDGILLSVGPAQSASAAGVARVAGFKGPILGSNSAYAKQLLATKAKPALLQGFYIATAGIPIQEDLPALKKIRDGYAAKFPGQPQDSAVVTGYSSGEIIGNAIKKACASKDLTREGLIKAHRSTNAFDNGQGGTLDFTYFDKPPTLQTFIVQPDEQAISGTKIVQNRTESELVKGYKVPLA
ncbi:ABC transporter substrate-binding protein [Actinomadura craniellae]|nr:ABC transporter substrate-binding protein [Actinomadura craniellae]